MNTKVFAIACLVLAAWFGNNDSVQAQHASPPCGTWVNKGDIDVVLSISPNGDVYYRAGVLSVQGRWTWLPNSTGGIITIHYVQPGTGNVARLYYAITPLGPDRIELADLSFRIIMNRQ